jgi:hypothetical protein
MRKLLILTGLIAFFVWIQHLLAELRAAQVKLAGLQTEYNRLRTRADADAEDAGRYRRQVERARKRNEKSEREEQEYLASLSPEERIDYRMKQAIIHARIEERLRRTKEQLAREEREANEGSQD